jgi:hypothetical protein
MVYKPSFVDPSKVMELVPVVKEYHPVEPNVDKYGKEMAEPLEMAVVP